MRSLLDMERPSSLSVSRHVVVWRMSPWSYCSASLAQDSSSCRCAPYRQILQHMLGNVAMAIQRGNAMTVLAGYASAVLRAGCHG